MEGSKSDRSDSDFAGPSSTAQKFNQPELNDLIRDLNLSKESSELLASRLKEKNLLDSETKVTFYRNREKNMIPFFSENNKLVFCSHEWCLFRQLQEQFKMCSPTQWQQIWLDSNRSLYQHERRIPDNLFSPGKDKVSRTPVDDLCRLEDGEVSPWPTKWVCKISMLHMSMG